MRWLLALLFLIGAVPAAAKAPQSDPALTQRIDGLVAILDGTGDYETYFAPSFRMDVPKAKLDAIAAQLKVALGRPLRVGAIVPVTRTTAKVTVAYERGTAAVEIAVGPLPGAVTGLFVRGTTLTDDDFTKLEADFRKLPGASGFGVYALDGAVPRPIAALNGDVAAPIGSGFKLWVLAEAARQVKAGRRRWSDVVPLGAPSLASGITQTWPAGTPVTLQSLATLMISISDNTAADSLVTALGRIHVEAVARAAGAPARSFPILTTREAFALKTVPARSAAWATADLAARRRMLVDPALSRMTLDAAVFGDTPVAIDAVEWFASPAAMAKVLGALKGADPTTRAILAVNPGTDPTTAGQYTYVGYKGGSEPGVISASFLVRRKDGAWRAVAGNWHRADGETPELTFLALMNRALVLAAR